MTVAEAEAQLANVAMMNVYQLKVIKDFVSSNLSLAADALIGILLAIDLVQEARITATRAST